MSLSQDTADSSTSLGARAGATFESNAEEANTMLQSQGKQGPGVDSASTELAMSPSSSSSTKRPGPPAEQDEMESTGAVKRFRSDWSSAEHEQPTSAGSAPASVVDEAIPHLHPQFRHETPIVLDASLPFVLTNPHATQETAEAAASAAAAAAAAAAASATPTGIPMATGTLPTHAASTRRMKPKQEKARAAFVAAHAGQSYEQMVLEHAYSSDRLFWLKEAYNLTWRTGRWSQDEEDRATAALDKFCKVCTYGARSVRARWKGEEMETSARMGDGQVEARRSEADQADTYSTTNSPKAHWTN